MEWFMVGITVVAMICVALGEDKVSKYNLLAWQLTTLIWVAICMIKK